MEERDRYKRLLSQYTSTPLHFNSTHINHSTLVAEGVTGNPTVKKSDTDASYFDIHKNRDILLSPRDHNFSRYAFHFLSYSNGHFGISLDKVAMQNYDNLGDIT